jgi:hypothetical protein
MGPLLFKPFDAPRYHTAWAVVVLTAIAAVLLPLICLYVCVRENRKRDAIGVEAFEKYK